jgi:hypothetical protein
MIGSKTSFSILCLLTLFFADAAMARTIYMQDGSEMEAQSAWKEGDTVYLRINSDLCLDFPASDVKLSKSGIAEDPGDKQAKPDNRPKAATQLRYRDTIDELLQVTGYRQDFSDIFGRAGRGEVEQILADSFSPQLAEKTLRKCLERKLGNHELSAVLTWYKSPVGAKVVEADSIWDFNRQEKTLTYVGIESAPGYKERMNLITQIEKCTGMSDAETRLTKTLLQRMLAAVPADFPDAYEVKESIKNEMPTTEGNRKKLIQRWAYSYREMSLNELGDYLRFLRSPTGKKYITAVREANEEIFRKVATNIENEFKKYVK